MYIGNHDVHVYVCIHSTHPHSCPPPISRTTSPHTLAPNTPHTHTHTTQGPERARQAVEHICSFAPDVLLLEKTLPGTAREPLLARDITVVQHVKPRTLERLSRCLNVSVRVSVGVLFVGVSCVGISSVWVFHVCGCFMCVGVSCVCCAYCLYVCDNPITHHITTTHLGGTIGQCVDQRQRGYMQGI